MPAGPITQNIPLTFNDLTNTNFVNKIPGDVAEWNGAAWVNIPGGGGTITGAANVGGMVGEVFRDVTGSTINMKTIGNASGNVDITNNANDIDIDVGSKVVIDDAVQTLTNKTITAASNDVSANALKSSGADVNTSGQAPPSAIGHVLTAQGGTVAGWEEPALPAGYMYNALLSFTGANSVSVGAGGFPTDVRSSDNTLNLIYTGALVCDITIAGAGGLALDKVEGANTWYYIYLIGDSAGVNPVSTLASDVFLTTITPAQAIGYDKSRLVGHVRNDAASNFLNFEQECFGNCRRYHVDSDRAGKLAIAGATSTLLWTVLSLAPYIPPLTTEVRLLCEYTPGVAGEAFYLKEPGSALTVAQSPFKFFGPVAGQPHTFVVDVPCSFSQIINWATTLFASDALTIYCIGWLQNGI